MVEQTKRWSTGTVTQMVTAEEAAALVGRLTALGVIQRGDPILERMADRLQLPEEGLEAADLVAHLIAKARAVSEEWDFAKGIGIAAPQIGISKAVAVVRPPQGRWVGLINPRIIDEVGPLETRWEGCLSFFGCRGEVTRHRTVIVASQEADGTENVRCFSGGRARLVLHELDHLAGRLYTSRMAPGTKLTPLEEYDKTGTAWE